LVQRQELESGSETDSGPVHSLYIHYVLRRKAPHDPTFGVYQHDTGGSFKIGRSGIKYNDQRVSVDGKSTRQHQVSGNFWRIHLIKPWALLKTNKPINEYYYSLMRIELIIVLQARSEQTKAIHIRG
jgi:hypothetical protein